jgi:hypothetical protein
VNIDQVGVTAKRIMSEIRAYGDSHKNMRKAMNQRVAELRPLLREVWDALEAGQVVNGCSSKGEWAAWSGQTTRNIQYHLKGGNLRRNRRLITDDRLREVAISIGQMWALQQVRISGMAVTTREAADATMKSIADDLPRNIEAAIAILRALVEEAQ